MIHLTCTQCKAQLEMDDAFAGGVCRCQYCGTIQTVPSHLKSTATTTAPQPASSRSLYSKATVGAGGAPNSGIYELADAVGGGSTGSGLNQRRAAEPNPPAKAQSDDTTESSGMSSGAKVLLVSSGSVILALIVVIFWLIASRMNSTPPAPVVNNTPAKSTPAPAPVPTPAPPKVALTQQPKPSTKPPAPTPAPTPFARPTFLNVPIEGKKIAYVLDRGDRTRPFFDPLKEALFKSLESLGGNREFYVVWWKKTSGLNPNMQMPNFPKRGMSRAAAEQITKCRSQFERTMPGGKTHINEAIEEAMSRSPDAIVIVTAKGKTLDSDFLSTVEEATSGHKIPIHTFAIGDNNGNAVLKSLAEKSGGHYMEISSGSLGQ